ncbi:MAG: formylglycine-generating enzyme family protein [Candidatus Sumerlaeaceae bacterium]|nr:formylglycine-generating enzyme family protein [Candidatus Sumerlaeaceae bacterium]
MKTLLLGLCAVLLAVTGTAQGVDAVAEMAAKYEVKRREIDQVSDKVTNEALAEFKSLLDSLEKKYTAQGNLEGVISVRKAKEYTVSPNTQIPGEAFPASGPLYEILKHYIQKRSQAEEACLSSNVALTRAYLAALDRMKEGFAKQSKIEEAMTVSVEIERVTQAEPDLVEMARSQSTASSDTVGNRDPNTPPHKPLRPIPGRPWISPSGIEFVYIRPGTFMMGSPGNEPGRDNDETQHRVTLTKGFWLGKYEVTQGQWEAVMGSNPSYFVGRDLPVERVSWTKCQEFLKRLCEMEKVSEGVYRLPTEAEWEYACRAGTTEPYAGEIDEMGWYRTNSGLKTNTVGLKKANSWGLHDMHGNVREWCADVYRSYPAGEVTSPPNYLSAERDLSSARVSRGGSWGFNAWNCRSAQRSSFHPSFAYTHFGFRILLDDKPNDPSANNQPNQVAVNNLNHDEDTYYSDSPNRAISDNLIVRVPAKKSDLDYGQTRKYIHADLHVWEMSRHNISVFHSFKGRRYVIPIHPEARRTPTILKLEGITKSAKGRLTLNVSGIAEDKTGKIVVKVDGKTVWEIVPGQTWHSKVVDFDYNSVSVECHATRWFNDWCYITYDLQTFR